MEVHRSFADLVTEGIKIKNKKDYFEHKCTFEYGGIHSAKGSHTLRSLGTGYF
jgi:hypothetical protein